MKKVLFFVFGVACLLTSACSYSSVNYLVKEVSIPQSNGNAQMGIVNQVEAKESELTDTNKKLADKVNTIARDASNMNNEIASLKARLYLTPDLNEVYDITPIPQIDNGWYVIDQIPILRLKGYDTATRVRFMAAASGEDYSPAELGADQDQSDGWSYYGPLIGIGNTVVWAEVTEANGNLVQTPVIPILSKVAEDVTAIKPAKLFKDIADPKAVVAKYYQLISKGDYQSAWDLIHPSERDQPSSGARNALRQQYWALQGTKSPELDKIVSSKLLDTYKIYVTQILATDVMEMKLKFAEGNEKMIHLLKDPENRWRLFWEPSQGLE